MIAVADNGFAFVEKALCLHEGALGSGPHAPSRSGLATSIVEPILIVLACDPAVSTRAAPPVLEHFLRPAAVSGWRSECVFRRETGGTVRIELVTRTPSGAAEEIGASDVPLPCDDKPAGDRLGGRRAARTAALQRLGKLDRAWSDRQAFRPDRVFALGMSDPSAKAASSILASLWSLLNSSEAAARIDPRHRPVRCSRRLQVFAEIETGENCAVSIALFRDGGQMPARQSIRSSIRRVPDGATLAVGETVLW